MNLWPISIKDWFAAWGVMNFLLVLLCLAILLMTFILSYAVIVEKTCVFKASQRCNHPDEKIQRVSGRLRGFRRSGSMALRGRWLQRLPNHLRALRHQGYGHS